MSQLAEQHALTMALVCQNKLSDDEKLDLLQRLDRFRVWESLNEKRYCLVCGKIISGREIQVVRNRRGNERLRVVCPTAHCDASPVAWARPTEEVLIAIMEVERAVGTFGIKRREVRDLNGG